MPLLDEARRRIRDYFSYDEEISVRPSQALRDIEPNLGNMTATERTRAVEHIKAYSDLYYQGRHNERVPEDVSIRLRNLEHHAERLNTVDAARQIVKAYGGPPTRETVLDALDRSYKERHREQATVARQVEGPAAGRKGLEKTRQAELEISGR